MHNLAKKYSKLLKAPLMGLFLLIVNFSFAQTNEKTKDKEIKQIKEINKDYDRPAIKQKREDYLTQTREQRLGTGKQKIKSKSQAQKDNDYIKKNSAQSSSSGNIKGKTQSQKETKYINKTAEQRSFKGDEKRPKGNKSLAKEIKKNSSGNVNAGTPQEREYKQVKKSADARNFSGREKTGSQSYLDKKAENKNNMSKYASGDQKYQTKGEKESNYVDRTKGQRDFSGREKAGSQGYLDKKAENKKTMSKYASGDQKYQTKGEQESEYIKRTGAQRNYQGTIKTGQLSHLQNREENKKVMEKYSSGDLKYQTKGEKEDAYLKRTAAQRNFQGNIKTNQLSHLQKRDEVKKEMEKGKSHINPGDMAFLKQKEENKKLMEKYSGDLRYMTKGQKEDAYLKRTHAMRTYQGDIDRGNLYHLVKRAEVKAEMEKYSTGDIAWRDLEKREKQRRERAKKMASYSGSVLTKDLEKWRKSIRKKEKDIANFQGNIKIKKRKEGQHPSAAYKGGYIANSYTQKARMRKKMLKKYGRKGDIDMPAHLKEKQKKAKYSRDESEIWW